MFAHLFDQDCTPRVNALRHEWIVANRYFTVILVLVLLAFVSFFLGLNVPAFIATAIIGAGGMAVITRFRFAWWLEDQRVDRVGELLYAGDWVALYKPNGLIWVYGEVVSNQYPVPLSKVATLVRPANSKPYQADFPISLVQMVDQPPLSELIPGEANGEKEQAVEIPGGMELVDA